MASSYLKPAGSKPVNKYDESDPDGELAYAYDVSVWESRYCPGNMDDNDSSTVWSEGVDGPGIGEVIVIGPIDISKPVSIWSGHGKSENLFFANNRPKLIEVSIIKSGQIDYGDGMVESSVSFRNLSIVSQENYTLKDYFGYQELTIKKSLLSPDSSYLIAIKIVTTYPGTKYDDTCISEIKNK